MDSHSLNKVLLLINTQLTIHDKLSADLAKASSLSVIGAGEDLSKYSESFLQNYFWVLADFIKAARCLNQTAQKNLFIEQDWFKSLSLQERVHA